jgi:hypothetical protein
VPANGNIWLWHREEHTNRMRYCSRPLVPPAFRGVRASGGQETLACGHGARLQYRPPSITSVRVIFDADEGTLAFSLDGHAPETILEHFPLHTAMRPWVCIDEAGKSVRLQKVVWAADAPN